MSSRAAPYFIIALLAVTYGFFYQSTQHNEAALGLGGVRQLFPLYAWWIIMFIILSYGIIRNKPTP